MTKEQIELLFKDLCGRLPYKVYAQIPDEYGGYTSAIESIDIDGFVKDFEGTQIEIENIKPYLLPLSSMTLDQGIEYSKTLVVLTKYHCSQTSETYDWLNKNHFDYRGLIPMGLAIDATGLNIY
ncbi:MAG: hypothetical protein J6V44_12755 [Methanobrevibacter sp.]|nr:hypothetical protein [Methanobrevibacter sp.]